MSNKDEILDEDEYPSNTIAERVAPIRDGRRKKKVVEPVEETIIEKKKVTRKIKNRAVVRRKSILGSLFGDDTRSVVSYIVSDVLVPAFKSTITEMISSGIEMLVYGESGGHRRSRGRDRDRSTVSYSSYYDKRDARDERRGRRVGRRFDLDEITFRKGTEAADVLEDLIDLLDKYDEVTVSDFYELAGVTTGSWIHEKWGWKNLDEAHCTHTRGGYMIVFPDPKELD